MILWLAGVARPSLHLFRRCDVAVSKIRRDMVDKALEEFHCTGLEAMLEKYGGGPAAKWYVEVGCSHYDQKLVVRAAHKIQGLGDLYPLGPGSFNAGQARSLLKKRGYQVVSSEEVQVVVESRKRRISERLERQGAYRQFIQKKGYRCEACGWSINEKEQAVWRSSFELHHLTPVSELEEADSREVRSEDFAVLCASCHRAIHRTNYVSDINGFAQTYRPSDRTSRL